MLVFLVFLGRTTAMLCRLLEANVSFSPSFLTWRLFAPLNIRMPLKTVWREAAWSSGLGRWIWNLEVPGSNPSPYYYLDLFSVVPSSIPRPRCVNSQLVSLPPVGILNSLLYLQYLFVYLFAVSPINTVVLNTLDSWGGGTREGCLDVA